jgi:hypothetical protein
VGLIGGGSLLVLLGLVLSVFHLATAYGRVKLCVAAGRLSVVESNFLGTRSREWDRNQIAAIRASVEPRYNAKDLVVQLHGGSRQEMLGHCTADDLKWVATLLRDALQVPSGVGS